VLLALWGGWGENQAENHRLSSELHHLRKNVGMSHSVAQGWAHSGNPTPQPTSLSPPNMFPAYMANQGPMQHVGGPAFPGRYIVDQHFALSSDQMAADMGLTWPPTKPEPQANLDQDWKKWG